MNYATISADVISYTSLNVSEKRELESGIRQLIDNLSEDYAKQRFFGRLVQGDYIEIALAEPAFALRIALLLKTFVKSIVFSTKENDKSRLKYFFEHGIRLAVAVAPLITLDTKKGIIDGEAIYMSGRAIKNYSTSNKQKIVIKNTMFFACSDDNLREQFDVVFMLLDTILSKCSSKQCEVIFFKLMNLNENDIAQKLGKYQSTISQHSTAAGWLAIEKAVNHFENTFQ
ncbi:fumarate hydratase [Maribellus comscasis]|uniref:Fumarate hydratase n=1 Tax=Maribellus comscasis TaxID=2681766 RepID=A0A6I6JVA0_9BACT|nr:fumarate hydratase [Maribellus comscasis]QGY47026.1 fumarate hydratase [Maribellus comscasis]